MRDRGRSISSLEDGRGARVLMHPRPPAEGASREGKGREEAVMGAEGGRAG